MGQACFTNVQINQKPPKLGMKCFKCNLPILDISTHKCPVLKKALDSLPSLQKSKNNLKIDPSTLVKFHGGGVFKSPKDIFNLKIFSTPEQTITNWIQQPLWVFPTNICVLYPQMIKNRSFQQKLYWFRINIERLRISWQNGAQKIKVDRSNILMSSKKQLEKINLRKQVKIAFTDETVDDAGGLLREYMHLALKQIFSPQLGIFEMSESHELAYKFKWDDGMSEQLVIETMKILGLIIGKAIFERISINCYLDRTILRQIASQPIHLQDVYTYDQNIYNTLKSILNSTGVQETYLNYCIYRDIPGQKHQKKVQLIPNGQNAFVNDTNKFDYAKKLIHYHCTVSCQKYLTAIRQNIYKVVPFELLSVFQPIQLQMMLYGPTVIDTKDWKAYTQYKGYKSNDKQIQWFWEYVQRQNQQKLRNLLHYVTGTTRVPILGFKYLESNRNQIVQFMIQKSEYDKTNPYPKSYTCFNRLHLPAYKSKDEMFQRLDHIIANELTHFGLD